MKFSVFYDHIVEAAKQEKRTVESVCKEVSTYDISGVEIENTRLMNEREEVLSVLEAADMEISCMYGFFDFAHTSTISDGLDMVNLADELKIKKIMLIPGPLTRREFYPFIYQKKVKKMTDIMSEICKYAKSKNIMVVLEDFDHKDYPYATSKQLLHFLKSVPDLYCTFDTGNFLYSEEDSFKVLPLFLDKIRHVHCKDRTFQVKEGEVPKATVKGRNMYSSPVGSGCIKMKEILDIIIENGYDDYLAIEHFDSLCQLQDIKTSVKWLEENI